MTKTATSKAKDNVTAMKDDAVAGIELGVEAVQDKVSDVTEQAAGEIRKLTETSTQFVRENPGAAVAGAVGIGILVGLALRGRD